MPKTNNIPEVRFAGFTDAWEQRKLGELADIVGGGTPSTGVSDYWDGNIDWYAPAEIAEQIYLTSSQRKITEEGYNHSSAKMLPVGTVLFTSRAGIGKTAILARKGCTNQGFQSIVPHKGELDSYFIFSRTEELKQYGETVGAGSTFVEVSGKQMANMELMMPKTMAEQKTIGQYFANLDRLITLHQRKYERLKNVKKSMLEKMFPKNGSNIPEIRFAGFTDAWEQRKLDTITDVRDGTHDSPQYVETGHPFITSKNVKDGFINYEDIQYVSDKDYEEINKRSKVDKNDILMGMIGTIGNIALVRETPDFAIKNVALIKDIGDVYYRYLYHCLQSNSAAHQLDENLDGGTQKFIALNKIRELVIPVPSEHEQHKIGDYMESLDNLITLHQRKLEKLQNIKKSMLEKMFV